MDTLFFYLTKLGGLLLSPDAVILLVLLAGFGLLFTSRQKAARWCLGLPLAASVFIACLPVDEWLLYPLEKRFLGNPMLTGTVDGILVLGGAIDSMASLGWEQPQVNAAGERLSAAASLARRYPAAPILFTGGSGMPRYPNIREADYARAWFAGQQLPDNRVFFESASRNTVENAQYSIEMIQPSANEQWLLVTSAAHMPRAMGVFCKQGWALQAWPVDYRSRPNHLLRLEFDFAGNLAGLRHGLYEWAGLLVYYASGKTSQLFPHTCTQTPGE